MRWSDGKVTSGSLWYAGFEAKHASVLAAYTEGPLNGLAAVTETPLGKGRIIMLGTLPPPDEMQNILRHTAAQCEIHPVCQATSNVLAVPREGEAARGIIVMEIENRPGTCILLETAWDVLNNRERSGEVELAPYEIMVLQTASRPMTGSALRSGRFCSALHDDAREI